MSLELLAVIERRTCAVPLLRVRCPTCASVYVTAQWPGRIKKTRECMTCAHRRRRR